jgi:4'-phosphopantetheinyl transferase
MIDTADVWRIDLSGARHDVPRLATVLSDDELVRAGRFRFERHRRRFIVRRAALRSILSTYVGVPPRDIAYRTGTWGKLELREASARSLSFNSSHSEDWALIAVTLGHRVGVDIEMVRDLPDREDMERRFFSTAEQNQLISLNEIDRLLGFFLCWTRKEALVKAIGLGLHLPLESFDVSVVPGEPPAVLRIGADLEGSQPWTMLQPDAPPEFVAALAVDHPIREVAHREWDGLTTVR